MWHSNNVKVYHFYTVKLGQSRIRKIRDTIPSVAGLFERLYKNSTDSALGVVC